MQKTILLTGAAGSVGFETLKELLKNHIEYNIRIFELKNRKNLNKLKPFKNNISVFWGDITNYNDVLNAVKGCDTIIHTAALIPPIADEFPELAEKINFGGTENICKAINETNPDIFLIYTSSISVYGDRTENPEITTSDELKPCEGDYYAVTKIKAENIIKKLLKNYTIFRLSAVMHPKMKLDPLFFHMPLNTVLEIVTTKDTGFALAEAVNKKEYLNSKIFNLAGGEKCRITYEEFLNKNFKLFGLKKLNFPKYAFAEKNFHCGIYQDNNELNIILNFQRTDIEDYLNLVKNTVHPVQKFTTSVFRNLIKKQLLNKSEPFHAFKTADKKKINRFFISSKKIGH